MNHRWQRSRSVLAYGLALGVLAATVAACGGKKGEPAVAEPEAPPNKTTSTTTPGITTTINDLDPITLAYPASGVALGQAYDYAAQRWLPSSCVSGVPLPLGAGEMTVSFKDLQDRQQIFESLKISVSGGGSIGVGSASTSADYAKSTEIKTEKRNILATVDSMKGGEHLGPAQGAIAVTLNQLALTKAKLVDERSDPFRAACGDGYVAAIRKGARMSGVLSYAMDAQEIQESFLVSASGSYGPAKAKASMDRVRKDTTNAMKTEVSLLQIGGNRAMLPTTPAEFIDKLGKFGAYTADDAVPLEVVVLPYRVLGDVPADVRAKPLPDLGVRGLAAHYWRLSDLSQLYARAAMNPSNYYHAYVAPEQLVTKARLLQNAALCVAEMMAICSSEGVCQFDKLSERSRVKEVCVPAEGFSFAGDVPADQKERAAVELIDTLDAALGWERASKLLKELPRSAVAQSAEFLTQHRKNQTSKPVAVTTPAANAVAGAPLAVTPLPSKPQANALLHVNFQLSAYDVWFRHFARAPWPRAVTADNTAVTTSDMTSLLSAYCKARSMDCTNATLTAMAANGAQNAGLPSRETILREFIVGVRLFPVAAAVCESQLTHPMCQLPDVLYTYVDGYPGDEAPVFGTDRGFRNLTAVVSPAPPRARPPRPEPPSGCGRPPRGYVC